MTYQNTVDAAASFRNAGETPAARTFGMVTEANESDDIEAVKAELNHTRAHYQSLEYMLTAEEQIIEAVNDLIAEGAIEAPETPDDMLRLVVRFYNRTVLEEAYAAAHQVGIYQQLGIAGDVDQALQLIYNHLDFVDHEKEAVIENELQDILDTSDDDD